MRIEKIEVNKIKVTVSKVELNNMNINIKNLRPDSPQLHNFLFGIMERLKKETDFNPYTGQIVVEAMPTEDNIILTVTKISEEKNNRHITKEDLKSKKIRAVVKKKPVEKSVFYFDDFEALCRALVHIDIETVEKASYYKAENHYVLLTGALNRKDMLILREFTDNFELNNSLAESFLQEHFSLESSGDELVNMTNGLIKLYNVEK